jgi:hypothetical protein
VQGVNQQDENKRPSTRPTSNTATGKVAKKRPGTGNLKSVESFV